MTAKSNFDHPLLIAAWENLLAVLDQTEQETGIRMKTIALVMHEQHPKVDGVYRSAKLISGCTCAGCLRSMGTYLSEPLTEKATYENTRHTIPGRH